MNRWSTEHFQGSEATMMDACPRTPASTHTLHGTKSDPRVSQRLRGLTTVDPSAGSRERGRLGANGGWEHRGALHTLLSAAPRT